MERKIEILKSPRRASQQLLIAGFGNSMRTTATVSDAYHDELCALYDAISLSRFPEVLDDRHKKKFSRAHQTRRKKLQP